MFRMSLEISFQTDPVSVLMALQASPGLVLRCPKPSCAAEENYLRLFEGFSPEMEWSEEGPPGLYDVQRLAIPEGPILPVTGEFLQSLCDYTILNREKATEENVWVEAGCPFERQRLIEEDWSPETFEARSLFIYPMADSCTAHRVFSTAWPNLRLIVFHNSDYPVDYNLILKFVEENPKVHVWAENALRWHPRIRCVPIGEENRIWRKGAIDYDPPITISRAVNRSIAICLPHWGYTHPIREEWRNEPVSTPRLFRAPQMSKEEYLEFLTDCRAMLCPRGNGFDTHRVWECIAKGVWPIVQDNAHTQLLLRQYPSMPLLTIDSPSDLDSGLDIPPDLPFHPVILREYWEILFRSLVD